MSKFKKSSSFPYWKRGKRKRLDQAVPPLTAEQIITGLRSDLGPETRVLIQILSGRALFIHELATELKKEPKYPTAGLTDKEIIHKLNCQRLKNHRHGKKIFGCCHGQWFVYRTLTDPAVRRQLGLESSSVDSTKPLSPYLMAGWHQVRNIVFDLLKRRGPLVLGQIIDEVLGYIPYQGLGDNRKKLRIKVSNVLVKNKKTFCKYPDRRGIIPRHNARWGLAEAALPTSKKLQLLAKRKGPKNKRQPKRRNALYAVMMTQKRILGWSLPELIAAVSQPNSPYQIRPGLTKRQIRAELIGHLCHPHDSRFQHVSQKRKARWRALWSAKLKVPSSAVNWDKLTKAISDDLGLPLTFDELIKNIRLYGSLFGWQTIDLPTTFLQNQVANAILRLKGKDSLLAMEFANDKSQDSELSTTDMTKEPDDDIKREDEGEGELFLGEEGGRKRTLPKSFLDEDDDGLAGLAIIKGKF